MVSKVAVIAIVGIVAIPILLGYALNLNEVTETDYKTTGDSVNVTPLLQNDVMYNYANADVYQLNTNFRLTAYNCKTLPIYQGITTKKTALPAQEYTYGLEGGQELGPGQYPTQNPLSTWRYMYFQSNITSADTTNYLNLTIMENGSAVTSITRLYTMYWDAATSTISYTHYVSGQLSSGTLNISNPDQEYNFNGPGTYAATGYLVRSYADNSNNNTYVDFAAGFKFAAAQNVGASEPYYRYSAKMPNYTRMAICTIDLSSITSPSYQMYGPGGIYTKTTTDGIVKWVVTDPANLVDPIELYYDQTSTNNTYQIKLTVDEASAVSIGSGMVKFSESIEYRYVGAWPSLIGEANYYQSYKVEKSTSVVGAPSIPVLSFGGYSLYSPIIRIDAAEFRAFEYPIIADKTYDPASFKTNPSTTIKDPVVMGPSFEFGGNTYTISKGSITLGTHQIPVKGLVLSSVPNGNGEYDNKIGDTVISTTAAPSAITFNGKWSASISTVAQEQYQYTKTEWIAGGFAWNGMDDNFLMVGLITSLGAFIALGIYARRSRASVWPLMLVCGGAAALFFIML